MSDLAIYIDDLKEIIGISTFQIWMEVNKKTFHAKVQSDSNVKRCNWEQIFLHQSILSI